MATAIFTNPSSFTSIADGTAGDAFSLTNGPPESGFQTSEFIDPANTIIFANQTDFMVDGEGTKHAVTVDNPNPAAGLEAVTFQNLGLGSDVEGGSSSGADITVGALSLEFSATGDIGDTRALRTQVSSLMVANAGNVDITNGISLATTLNVSLGATGVVTLTNSGTINTNGSGISGTFGINVTASGLIADLDTGSGAEIDSTLGAVVLQVGEDINLGDAVGTGSVIADTGVNLSSGRNVTLNANALIENTASGNVSINAGMVGTGGNITMLSSVGAGGGPPAIFNNASTGAISLTTGAGGTLTVASTGGAAAIASTNGAVTLAADAMVIGSAIISGTAVTTLEPVTAGQAITLGRTNAPGMLGLTQTELDQIDAGAVRIGNNTAGNILIASEIGEWPGNTTLSLINNGSISEGAFGSLLFPALRISSTGPVTLGSTTNSIVTLAATATDGLTVNDNTTILTVGTVDTVSGITTTNSAINLTADGMVIGQQLNAGSGIVTLSTFSAAQQISLGGTSGNIAGTLGVSDAELGEITAGTLRIDADTGNITTGGNISSHAGYSTLSLATAGFMELLNNVSVTNLALNAGIGIAVDGINAIGTVAFFNAINTAVIIDFTSLTIGAVDGIASSSNLGSTTAITVAGTGNSLTFATGLYSAGAATLTASGSFVDKGNGTFVDVTAPSLALAAQTGVGTSTTPLQTQIGALSATTVSGGIYILNDSAVPGTLNIGVGTTGVENGGTGDISIINNGTINSLVNDDIITGDGNITLKALGNNADVNLGSQAGLFTITTDGSGLVDVEAGRDLNLGNSAGTGVINGGFGSVKLVAGRDLIIDANAFLTSSGSITATAGRNITMLSTPGNLTQEGFTTFGGAIALTAGAGATMTLTSDGTTAVSSGGGNITLTADFLNIGKAVNAGSGYVLIEPVTAGEQISLGSAATGGLTLSNTELDDITAKTIIIGNSTAGEVSLAGTVAPTSGTNLAINTGSGVIASGSINLGTGVLSIGFDQSGTGATVDLSNAAITAGSVYVEGGAGNDTFISGGTGETFIGGSGADTFEGTAAHLSGDTITSLKVGDKIDLLGLVFSVGGTATLDTGNLLQIEEDGQAIFLQLNPSQNFSGDAFVLSSDGQGGTDISPEPQQQLSATGLRFVGAGRSGAASDTLVLQNTSNAAPTLWTVSGASAAVTLEPSPGPGWTIDTTGDAFDAGSDNTILWQNTADLPVLWEINGATIVNAVALPDPGPGWTIEATGDAFDTGFDNTILWENTSDLPVLWEMNGATIVNDVALPDPGPGWTILGTGDFFHAGFNNTVLWQNTGGLPVLWEMNGGTIVNDVALPNPGPGWSIRGVGNFFGDGHADSLLWQDTAGLPVLWEMNGGTIVNDVALPNPGSSWTIEGGGVVTGNGDYDIFLEDTSGQVAEWSMNGSQLLASNFLTSNSLILDAPNAAATGSGSEQITFNSTNQTFIDGSSVYNDTVVGFSQPQGDRIHLTTDTVADALAHSTLVNAGQDTLILLSDSSTVLLKGVTSINSSFFA